MKKENLITYLLLLVIVLDAISFELESYGSGAGKSCRIYATVSFPHLCLISAAVF